jgi:hypothetical protein
LLVSVPSFHSAIVTATTVNGNSLVPAVKAEEGIDLSSTSVLITTVFW